MVRALLQHRANAGLKTAMPQRHCLSPARKARNRWLNFLPQSRNPIDTRNAEPARAEIPAFLAGRILNTPESATGRTTCRAECEQVLFQRQDGTGSDQLL